MVQRCIAFRFIELVCVLAMVRAATGRCPGAVVQKSITQAQEECVEILGIPRARLAVYNEHIYPQDAETKCMVRCMGLNLGWWNDTEGVQQPAISAYFHPDPDDCQYGRRTYHCLKSQRLDSYTPEPHDACDRAYESFRCYYEQYGNIVVTPQFVPLTALRITALVEECVSMLQLYPSGGCAGGGAAASPISPHDMGCLYRCVFLRSGLYSEQYGPNLDRFYVQCGGYNNETLFRDSTGSCFRRLKSECLNDCDLMYRFINDCFPEGGTAIDLNLKINIVTELLTLLTRLLPVGSNVVPALGTLGSVLTP